MEGGVEVILSMTPQWLLWLDREEEKDRDRGGERFLQRRKSEGNVCNDRDKKWEFPIQKEKKDEEVNDGRRDDDVIMKS